MAGFTFGLRIHRSDMTRASKTYGASRAPSRSIPSIALHSSTRRLSPANPRRLRGAGPGALGREVAARAAWGLTLRRRTTFVAAAKIAPAHRGPIVVGCLP